MNVLDSPLDALALNYLSFGFLTAVNNIWTWVAVITAAVSLWRIKAAGSDPIRQIPDGSPPPDTAEVATETASTSTSASASTATTMSAPSFPAVETTEMATRGKFTVYYEDDYEVDDGGDGGFGEVGSGGCGGGGEYLCEGWTLKWERELKMRMGDDMGWYFHQDLTVLDGNVVRLWDGCKGRSTTHISFFPQVVFCSDS